MFESLIRTIVEVIIRVIFLYVTTCCSAGVGRSGTLIALDLLLKMAKTQGNVDVPKCVDGLRRQRMWMVQTLVRMLHC